MECNTLIIYGELDTYGLALGLGEALKIPHLSRTSMHILLDPTHAQENCTFLLSLYPSNFTYINPRGYCEHKEGLRYGC